MSKRTILLVCVLLAVLLVAGCSMEQTTQSPEERESGQPVSVMPALPVPAPASTEIPGKSMWQKDYPEINNPSGLPAFTIYKEVEEGESHLWMKNGCETDTGNPWKEVVIQSRKISTYTISIDARFVKDDGVLSSELYDGMKLLAVPCPGGPGNYLVIGGITLVISNNDNVVMIVVGSYDYPMWTDPTNYKDL